MASAAMAQTAMQSLGQALTQPAPRNARAGLQVRPCPSAQAFTSHTLLPRPVTVAENCGCKRAEIRSWKPTWFPGLLQQQHVAHRLGAQWLTSWQGAHAALAQ